MSHKQTMTRLDKIDYILIQIFMFSFYFTKAEAEGHIVSDLNVMFIFPMGM